MNNTAGGTRRILGSLRSADGRGVVRVEDRFDTDIDDLWSALTDPDRLGRWIGEVAGELRPGGEFRARFFDGWEGIGRVETCRAPEHLLLSVRDLDAAADQGADGAIEVRLTADGERTVLVWEERGMPLEHLAAYGAGIQVHVEELAAHVSGADRSEVDARWDQLLPAYQQLADGLG